MSGLSENQVVSGTSSDLSDDEFEELEGTLSKWTNYIHGWQDRYFSLKDGTLVYYKSERETDFGCRGAISIRKAVIKPHELDEFRFDVSVSSDCVWYLRTNSVEDRTKWVDTLEASKTQSETAYLRRHDSALSLTSNTFSIGSKSKTRTDLVEKLSEMETFRDLCCKQIDSLQSVFDYFAENEQSFSPFPKFNLFKIKTDSFPNVDFKGESITFKATTSGIISTLDHCIEIMNQREEFWKKKLEKEVSIRRRLEEKYVNAVNESTNNNSNDFDPRTKLGPEYEEGPNSQIGEDEFYDAVENALDKLQEEQNYRDKLKLLSEKPIPSGSKDGCHPLWETITKVTNEQLHYARIRVGDVWELFAEDGEMKMYKREEEIDGLVVDPLKAVHHVKGVTAAELCYYFFAPEFRQEWESTVEQATVLEKITDDTLIFLQLHKRIWPAAQRDSLFWSHRRKVKDIHENGTSDTWLVCNQSTQHPDAPESKHGGCTRINLTVIFLCDTNINRGSNPSTCSRDDVSCNITYCSVVNPGGWVPATALRAVYKREYPKFLKRFTSYVIEKTKDKPLMW